ncbi:MAG: DUF6929 family protein [Permianibacter sp.]
MLKPTPLRQLNIVDAAGRSGALSAASGLVCIGDFLHVIADDELGIASFRRSMPDQAGQLQTLLPGLLPAEKVARKRLKPDWEALLLVPASADYPHGSLLAFGSGSTPARRRAVRLGLRQDGSLAGDVSTYSLERFYAAIARKLDQINVEAVFLRADRIHFVSRGNRVHPISTVVSCLLVDWLVALTEPEQPLPALTLTAVTLPSLRDVVASVSDAVALADGWLATAIAEATDDTYHDGPCVGAALARFDDRHRLVGWWPLAEPIKLEGLVIAGDELLLVNDPDDAAIPAQLFSCRFPR